jgi:hypothetical protein
MTLQRMTPRMLKSDDYYYAKRFATVRPKEGLAYTLNSIKNRVMYLYQIKVKNPGHGGNL